MAEYKFSDRLMFAIIMHAADAVQSARDVLVAENF